MEIKYDNKAKYRSGGGKPVWKDEYDFLLVRQDWNGHESIYFNVNEIEEVFEKMNNGEIIIHFNYSILYGKDRETLEKILELGYGYPCYDVEWDKR